MNVINGVKRASGGQVGVVVLLCTLAGCSSPDFSPGPTTRPVVEGVVTNSVTGAKVQGAQISIAGKLHTTDSVGRYAVPDVPLGPQTITVTRVDYVDAVREVIIPASYFFKADFNLQPR